MIIPTLLVHDFLEKIHKPRDSWTVEAFTLWQEKDTALQHRWGCFCCDASMISAAAAVLHHVPAEYDQQGFFASLCDDCFKLEPQALFDRIVVSLHHSGHWHDLSRCTINIVSLKSGEPFIDTFVVDDDEASMTEGETTTN